MVIAPLYGHLKRLASREPLEQRPHVPRQLALLRAHGGGGGKNGSEARDLVSTPGLARAR